MKDNGQKKTETSSSKDLKAAILDIPCARPPNPDFLPKPPEPETPEEDPDCSKVTVKFIVNYNQVVAQIYSQCITIEQLKKDIGKKFQLDPKYLIISQLNEELDEDCQLNEACKNEFGIIEFLLEICSTAPKLPDGRPQYFDLQLYYSKFRLADFITVHIAAEDTPNNVAKNIIVKIQNRTIIKPFLGGYKDLKTGFEYHEAFTQTGPLIERIKFSGVTSRNTQTVKYRQKLMNTTVTEGTQSFGDAEKLLYITSANDVVITPGKYETYEEQQLRINYLGKIVLIQRNWRRFLMMRYMKAAAAEFRRLRIEQTRREHKRMDRYVERFQNELIIKTFPKTQDDFDLLFAQVKRWKDEEVIRINRLYTGGPKIAELCMLLEREIHLRNGIEQQRNFVLKALEEKRTTQELYRLGQPVKWIGYKNLVIEMDLIRTQRVRFFKHMYEELKKHLEKKERLELIDKTYEILDQEEDRIPQIDELLELFEREKNLILSSRYCDFEVLHKRELILFIEIIKHSKDHKPKKTKTQICDICKCVKPLTAFALSTRKVVIEICKKCYALKDSGTDKAVFRSILRAIQREERKYGTLTSYCFIMQEDDIQYLLNTIWHGFSILSKSSTEMRLPRFYKSDDWSPWNCVCLTELEARNHKKLNDLSEVYDANILNDIMTKHNEARLAFKKLADVEEDFVESGDWFQVGVRDKVL